MAIQSGAGSCYGSSCTEDDSRDVLFVEMLRAFRRSGGLAREAEIMERTRACDSPGLKIDSISGTLICFQWGQRFWLPWFQFDPADMSLRPGPGKVISELAPVFDGWALAAWFAQPNLWIGNARPIDLVDDCLYAVLGCRARRQVHRRRLTACKLDHSRMWTAS